MADKAEDLRESLRKALVNDLNQESVEMDERAKKIERDRPGGIDIAGGGNGMAPAPCHARGEKLVVGGSPVSPREQCLIDGLREDAESLRKLAKEIGDGGDLTHVAANSRRRINAIEEEKDRVWARFVKIDLADRNDSLESFQVVVLMNRILDASRVKDKIGKYHGFITFAGVTPESRGETMA